MNAYELAEMVRSEPFHTNLNRNTIADFIDQQADQIAELKLNLGLSEHLEKKSADRIAELEKEEVRLAMIIGNQVQEIWDLREKATPQTSAEPVAWQGEEWEQLAYELCLDDGHDENSAMDIIWTMGVIPEPWGERWLKYEDEAKRMIEMVRKYTTPQTKPLSDEEIIDFAKGCGTLEYDCEIIEFARAIEERILGE